MNATRFRAGVLTMATAAVGLLFADTSALADLIISEVVDATLPGGLPKFVELTNTGNSTLDLSNYSIGNFNNGSTDLAAASTVLSGMLVTGDSHVISYENGDSPGIGTFFDVYGIDPDNFDLGAFFNGNDVLALFLGPATGDGSDATLVDVYGVIGVDGEEEEWVHIDSYAFRIPNVMAASSIFDATEWTIPGPNSLETGDDEEERALIVAKTTPGTHQFTAALLGDMDCDGDVDFDDIDDFVLGLNDAADYESQYGVPPSVKGDVDGDNDLDFDDITGFVDLLSGGGSQSVPEPSTTVLLAIAGMVTLGGAWRNGPR